MILNVMGGIGKAIAVTGILKPETTIITNHPEPFMNNPNVSRIYPPNTPYLFEDVIKGNGFTEFDAYKSSAYHNEGHVTGEVPKIFLTNEERQGAEKWKALQTRPVILFQPFGQGGNKYDQTYRSLLPKFAKKLADAIPKIYKIYIIGDKTQEVEGYENLNLDIRKLFSIIPHIHSFIGVDSMLQHACSGFGKSGFVFWGGTLYENQGYNINYNHRIRKTEVVHTNPYQNDPDMIGKLNGINDFGDADIKIYLKWLKEVKHDKGKKGDVGSKKSIETKGTGSSTKRVGYGDCGGSC